MNRRRQNARFRPSYPPLDPLPASLRSAASLQVLQAYIQAPVPAYAHAVRCPVLTERIMLRRSLVALIVCPTRELALQVEKSAMRIRCPKKCLVLTQCMTLCRLPSISRRLAVRGRTKSEPLRLSGGCLRYELRYRLRAHYAMSGTLIHDRAPLSAYARDRRYLVLILRMLPGQASTAAQAKASHHRRDSGICLRARCAISGTDMAYGGICLRACSSMYRIDIGYGRIRLRARYAISGTDKAYGARGGSGSWYSKAKSIW